MQLSDYIGNSILILIPKIHEKKYQKVILHGVEAGGIWIESQTIMNEFLESVGASSATKTLAIFVPYSSVAAVVTAIDKLALNEKSLGL